MENLDTADGIEENSILAPLSQQNDIPSSQTNLKPSSNTNISDETTINHCDKHTDDIFDDSDDDLLNNFSMNFDPNETFVFNDKYAPHLFIYKKKHL